MQKTGILITNLGTPTAPTPIAVKKYLAEFLADPHVVQLPKIIWLPILHGFVLPFRSKKSANAYQKIWTDAGSPLLINSQKITEKLKIVLSDSNIHVELGMRYGSPSIADALRKLEQVQIEQLIVLPLYPQYSAAATGSTFTLINKIVKKWSHPLISFKFIHDYFDHLIYIAALADSIERHWQREYHETLAQEKEPALPATTTMPSQRKLLFSFHGLPENTIAKGDPYYSQCLQTATLVAERLQLNENAWQVVFQSRFGRQPWLKPYCDKTLTELPTQGFKTVDVICPGFPADCLETLEEMAIRNKEIFMAAGGENFHYIPALNDSFANIALLAKIIKNQSE